MSCLVVAAALWTSGAVSPTWTSFAAARAANDLTQAPIVDFSYAGYEHGEIGIPAATGVRYDVTAYGAVPNDDVDDRDAVDAAIRAAEAAGGGIVFFPPGRFHLSEVEGRTWGCINITGANVVLKGSGSGGPSATELFFRHTTVPQHGQCAPLAVPEVGYRASSGRTWQLWLAQLSHEKDWPTGHPAAASGARASRLQSRPSPRICPCRSPWSRGLPGPMIS